LKTSFSFLLFLWGHLFRSSTHNNNANQVTYKEQHYNVLNPYTLPEFEPTLVYSIGGDDDHYTMPPGQLEV
jgi:hypothetical protein